VQRVAVLGGGSWATALVKILNENGTPVQWFIRDADIVKSLQTTGHNPRYLSSVGFQVGFNSFHNNLGKAIGDADVVIVAIPAAFLEASVGTTDAQQWSDKNVVSAVKGMVPGKNMILAEFFHRQLHVPYERFAVISGPCHAEEVALEKLSYLTLASMNADLAEELCVALRCRFIKTTPSDDIYGTEYAAVMKNIYAIASGICSGLGYGDNFQAVLVSNAIQEMRRFVHALNPQPRDLSGSAYLGDLLVTAYSQFSRNRSFGNMVGRGYSVKSAQLEMNMIAEGYYAVKSIYELNRKLMVPMPITSAAYHILYEKISPAVEIELLREKFR
jgi:glycerol-3-phosphate dehydrogenase (NAD(P)+)